MGKEGNSRQRSSARRASRKHHLIRLPLIIKARLEDSMATRVAFFEKLIKIRKNVKKIQNAVFGKVQKKYEKSANRNQARLKAHNKCKKNTKKVEKYTKSTKKIQMDYEM